MKTIQSLIFFLLIHSLCFSQELKLIKATVQPIHHGDSPTETLNYSIIINKDKKFNWSIDSVIAIFHNSISYKIEKKNSNSHSEIYSPIKLFSKKDKGNYLITFSITKTITKEKAIAPGSQKIEVNNYNAGVDIFYTANGKTKKLNTDVFQELDVINVP